MSDDNHDNHYIKIWGILLVLLVVSVVGPEVAEYTPATVGKYIVLLTAFGIAFVKAYMVAKHFMHLNVERPVVHYFLGVCLLFVVLFFGATSPDIMKQEGRNWVKNYDFEAEKALCEKGDAEACKRAGWKLPGDDHHGDESHGDKHEAPAAH